MKKPSQGRNSNLELIRIISIFLIVTHHYFYHGYGLSPVDNPINQYLLGILYVGGKIGVDCFILISAYFMVHSRYTVKKFLELEGTVWFYTLGFLALFTFVLPPAAPLRKWDLIAALFPVGSNLYWFVTCYVILMVISPLLNQVIAAMTRRQYRILLTMGTVFWSVMPTLTAISYSTSLSYNHSNTFWFIFLYFVAGYIRRFSSEKNRSASRHFLIGTGSFLVIEATVIGFLYLGQTLPSPFFMEHFAHFSDLNSPLILLAAVAFFMGCLSLPPRHSGWINAMSGTVFGIYLIHENPLFRPFLWQNIFHCHAMRSAEGLILGHMLFTIPVVFLGCAAVDFIRLHTFGKLWTGIVVKLTKKGGPLSRLGTRLFPETED